MTNRVLIISILLTITSFLASCTGAAKTTDNTVQQTQPLRLATFSADSAYAMVARQVAFGPRVPGSEAHTRCGDFLTETLQAAGADTVMTQRATLTDHKGRPMPMRNIIARYNTDARRRVLLAAHWDTRPWADNDPDPANHTKPVPGANDGASGVGILLEIARLLGEKAPQAGVDIVLLDCEDSGESENDESWGLGAQYFADHMPYTSADMPAYGILLDMVGDHNARFHRELLSEYMARSVNDRIQAMARLSGYEDRFVDKPGGGVTDDHTFLNRAGIPTADIIDCVNPTTGSFPPTWHTVADDMRSISTETLNAVGQTVTNIIYSERN